MALGAFWFSIMGLLVRLAGERLPTLQLIVLRCAITLVLSYAMVRRAGVTNLFGTNRRLLVLRGFLGAMGLLGFFHSLVRNPLAEANLLQYTNPLFAIIIAGVWLKERVGRAELISLGVCLLGVVFITRPAALFGTDTHALAPMNVLLGIGGAMFSGSAYAVVRRIGHAEHPSVVVFYLPLMGLLLSLPLSIGHWLLPTPWEWVLLIGTGVTTQVAQTYMTMGLRLETAARATTTGYLQIVFAGLWGALLLGEWPSRWTLFGAALIIGSALWLALGRERGGVGDE